MSRKKRKRDRRRAEMQPAGGDRGSLPRGVGGSGAPPWAEASRSELVLLRKAINHDWPVPMDRRGPIIADLMTLLRTGSVRMQLRVAWTLIFAARANLRAEEAERAAAKLRR
jgi:hypothetical protein